MSMVDTIMASRQAVGQQTRGRTPIFRLQLTGDPLDDTVLEADITMGEGEHDVCTLKMSSPERTTTEGILESPISFLYGVAPRTELFCGYVTSVTEESSSSGLLTWTMTATGPTKTMQTGTPHFWTQRTIPSAIETLVNNAYLGYTGHPHTYLWASLAQTDDTDWRAVLSLAKRLGWTVFNRYGIVMLYDPLQLFKEQDAFARLISETYVLAKSSADEEKTLLEFDPTEDAKSSVNQQGYKVAYFDDETVQVKYQSGDHPSYKFINNFVIRSAQEADIYVSSNESDISHWKQTAKARIIGNASLFPGMSVEILTSSQRYFKGKFNGRWLVRAVQHKMNRQDFQSNLVLVRPDGATQVTTGGYAPFWQTLTKPRPTLLMSAPGGVWTSSWSNSTARSASA